MIPYWLSRTELLLGDETTARLLNKHVLVVGLGGVGGLCAEMIARSGVGKMTIVDADTVDLSNCNRQIPALHSTSGRPKVEVMAERLKDINPQLELITMPVFLEKESMDDLLRNSSYDYAVDCIDTLSSKVFFLKACLENNVPVVSSLGAGGKVDPTQVQITDISETRQCNLARYVRKYLHRFNIRSGIQVVYSPERVDQEKIVVTEKAYPKKSIIGTISYMPAVFGCFCASVVIRALYEKE